MTFDDDKPKNLMLSVLGAILIITADITLVVDLARHNKPDCLDFHQLAEAGVIIDTSSGQLPKKCES